MQHEHYPYAITEHKWGMPCDVLSFIKIAFSDEAAAAESSYLSVTDTNRNGIWPLKSPGPIIHIMHLFCLMHLWFNHDLWCYINALDWFHLWVILRIWGTWHNLGFLWKSQMFNGDMNHHCNVAAYGHVYDHNNVPLQVEYTRGDTSFIIWFRRSAITILRSSASSSYKK